MRELLDLFLTFCRIGGFTFGGGYAMLPMIQQEIVSKKNWATDEEVMDYYAIGQCTPGIIAVNTATFIGYKHKGVIGAIVATLGVVFPSIVIITLIALYFSSFQEIAVIKHAFGGIRPAVAALILNTVIKMYKNSVKDLIGVGTFIISFLIAAFTKISPIFIVIISAIIGMAIKIKDFEKGSEKNDL